MKIKLIKEELKNFKGIKALTVNFGDITDIFGPNGSGKTTLYDGFLWTLFGKDSQDKKDFEIQPLDSNNNVIHNLETRVDLTLSVDGTETVFSRVFKEKWVKHRGQAEANLEGHTTEYYIDEVPYKQKDYVSKVDSLMNSETFKLVTNPNYFPSLDWRKQREILFEIIGNVEDSTVINYKDNLKELGELLGNNTMEEFKKKTKAQISKLKKDREGLPQRIDECNNQKSDLDWAALEMQKRLLIDKVKEIDNQITNASKKNEGKVELQDKLFNFKDEYNSKYAAAKQEINNKLLSTREELQQKTSQAKSNANKPLDNIKAEISSIDNQLKIVTEEMNYHEKNIAHSNNVIDEWAKRVNSLDKENAELRNKWNVENEKTFAFDETLSHCPTCGREYEQDKIEEIKAKAEDTFNKLKQGKLSQISNEGKDNNKAIELLKGNIEKYKAKTEEDKQKLDGLIEEKDKLESQLKELKIKELQLSETKNITFEGQEELENKIKELQDNLNNVTFGGQKILEANIEDIEGQIKAFSEVDNSSLVREKESLQGQIEDITKKLALQDNNKVLDNRIEELEKEEKNIGIKIAELEGYDFLCEEFTRTKVELLEGRINSKFKTLRFKLFNPLVNGGLEDTCIVLIDGVPYNNVNTAGRINAGVEIINTLSGHYGVECPLWLDNRESVNNLVDTDSQVINLIVSKDKELRVVVE